MSKKKKKKKRKRRWRQALPSPSHLYGFLACPLRLGTLRSLHFELSPMTVVCLFSSSHHRLRNRLWIYRALNIDVNFGTVTGEGDVVEAIEAD